MKGCKVMGNYLLEREIGHGSFATVYLASKISDPGHNLYAVKCIQKKAILGSQALVKLLNTEVSIMAHLHHPNIMHLHEHFETENNFYLVIDYCPQGDLETHMRKNKIGHYSEGEAIAILRQIKDAFVELRKYNIIHRDLKLSNIFLSGDRVVVGDFGFAKAGKELSKTKLGTPLSMAPEILSGAPYSAKADLWSIGVIFYHLLFGQPPFFGLSLGELAQNIKGKGGANLSLPFLLSPPSENLLRKLLEENPDKRISWNNFFNHPAIVGDGQKSTGASMPESFLLVSTDSSANSEQKTGNCAVESPTAQREERKREKRKEPNMNDVLLKMKQADLIQEHFFRYCHEMNKIHFLMNVFKDAFKRATDPSLLPVNSQRLFKISALLISKSKTIATRIKTSLVNRENIFDLPRFADFSGSPAYENLIDLFQNLSEDIARCLNEFEKSYTKQEKEPSIKSILHSDSNEVEVDSQLKKSVQSLFRSHFLNQNSGQILQVTILTTLGLNVDEMFPYWNGSKKFDWAEFVANNENFSREKLLDIARDFYNRLL